MFRSNKYVYKVGPYNIMWTFSFLVHEILKNRKRNLPLVIRGIFLLELKLLSLCISWISFTLFSNHNFYCYLCNWFSLYLPLYCFLNWSQNVENISDSVFVCFSRATTVTLPSLGLWATVLSIVWRSLKSSWTSREHTLSSHVTLMEKRRL